MKETPKHKLGKCHSNKWMHSYDFINILETGDYYKTLSLVFKICKHSTNRTVLEADRTIVENLKYCRHVSKYIIWVQVWKVIVLLRTFCLFTNIIFIILLVFEALHVNKTGNVAFRHVRDTIVAVEMQQLLHITSVCL